MITITIPLVNDNLHEADTEGFLLLLTPNSQLNDVTDEAASVAIRNGATLINIMDDDSKCTGDNFKYVYMCIYWEGRDGGGGACNILFITKSQ